MSGLFIFQGADEQVIGYHLQLAAKKAQTRLDFRAKPSVSIRAGQPYFTRSQDTAWKQLAPNSSVGERGLANSEKPSCWCLFLLMIISQA